MTQTPGRVQVLFVSNAPNDRWHGLLRNAVATLGCLAHCSQADAVPRLEDGSYGLVVVDAGAVRNVSNLVSDIRAADPLAKVVVVAASPHWKVARSVFKAGATDYWAKRGDQAGMTAAFRWFLQQARRSASQTEPGRS